jgi:hypothetical protein
LLNQAEVLVDEVQLLSASATSDGADVDLATRVRLVDPSEHFDQGGLA